MTALIIHQASAGLTLQDMGRPNRLAQGLSRAGAADPLALIEAAALLNLPAPVSSLEMPMMGGTFEVTAPTRVALTGAQMQASMNGAPVNWNTTVTLKIGDRLTIGPARKGTYGYLTPANGFATEPVMGGQGTHLTAGIGERLTQGAQIALHPDDAPDRPPMVLRPDERLSGGPIRVMPGPQTDLFDSATINRFFATAFTRSTTGNRQGVRLDFDDAPFASETKSLASDVIQPGDIQMTGDGIPYVLLTECQTMGGYPRIGTVIPQDLPRVAQAAPGTALTFQRITLEQADALWQPMTETLKALRKRVQPLRRDPHDIPDLLSYQLIGGMVRGDEGDAT
ncbi:biotin-dependent carboxyltransferase family protein [Pseudooceanicola sp. MF1-13]|uniref:5-oxoprolinase subunit C family protein n=1 Tax=Pseudooceanicola sp. MF1-13 TaxID=3379095 RepID=UPI0038916989